MFFQNDRLPYFISLLLGKDDENINDKIKSFFTADFCSLFRSFPGKTVTIRLLDAPLHEFIPRDADRLKKITAELRRLKIKTSPAELKALTQKLHEKNPMLGHRGVRSGITRPQIYNLQAEAAFTAQILCRSSKVHLAVMIPLVGLRKELDFSLNGKKIEGEIISGVHDAAEKIQAKYKIRLPYSA
ncbi:MAG TPA: pyruvate, phosphate dikinase, partial [Spirochaetia bacterium]|nr:pyruvate, phosphate dikinase [Spirochaetia bacterium]